MARLGSGHVARLPGRRDGGPETGHGEGESMVIELTEEQCAELQRLLEETLGDLSTEIADTDNPQYREGLRQKRAVLESVLYQLDNPPRVDA